VRRVAIVLIAAVLNTMLPSERGVNAQVGRVGGRVEISLHVPFQAYPENALVRVTVKLKNTSGRVLRINGGCLYGPVWAEVVAQGGAGVYPPALKSGAPLSCPPPVWVALRSGQIIRRQVYVILRRAEIRPVAELETGGYIYGHPLYLKLFRGRAPQVLLRTSPQLHADIHPAVPVRGPLHYMQWAKCPGTGGGGLLATYSSTRTWQSTQGTRLLASFGTDCGKGFEWHAIAGWVNQPVAHVDYVER